MTEKLGIEIAEELSKIEAEERMANEVEEKESWAELHCSQNSEGEWEC